MRPCLQVDAVAANNTEALDMLARMPWSDTSVIVSSMRMMVRRERGYPRGGVTRGEKRRHFVVSVGGCAPTTHAARRVLLMLAEDA
jgi:hypothetical protein